MKKIMVLLAMIVSVGCAEKDWVCKDLSDDKEPPVLCSYEELSHE